MPLALSFQHVVSRVRRSTGWTSRSLAAWVQSPSALVVGLALTMLLLWGVLSAHFNPSPPADSLEQVLLSQDLRLEYGKHPPMPTWILHGVNRWFGASIGATFILGALCSVATLLLLYGWARPLVGAPRAALATLLASTVEFMNAGTAYYNHNTVQLPLAMLTIVLFHRALSRLRLFDWALLGAAAGLMMLAKFSALVLFASFAAYLLWTQRVREVPIRRGLAVAALVFAAVMAPHLIAVQGDAWAPNRYAAAAVFPAEVERLDRLKSVWDFATSHLAKVAPALLIFALVRRRAPLAPRPPDARVALGPFLAIVGFGPLVLTLAAALLFGARLLVGWGATFHLLLTLWLVAAYPFAIEAPRRILVRVALACFAVQLTLWCLMIANGGRLPNLNRMASHRAGPAPPPPRHLAEVIQRAWADRSAAPLRYVVADVRTGAHLAVQLRGRPRVIDGDRPEFEKLFPLDQQAACGAVLVTARAPLTQAHAARHPQLDAQFAAASSAWAAELALGDGSLRKYFIGIRLPAPGGVCAPAL